MRKATRCGRQPVGLVATCCLVMAWGWPATARGGSALDMIEHFFGATNIEAVTGHGRLAVGISRDGDVTVLSWPNASYADQLGYISSNAIDARDRPRFGAPEGAGIFLGLRTQTKGKGVEITWLRDRTAWQIDQRYEDDGANVRTRHVSETLGLTVTVIDAVSPQAAGGPKGDVFVRKVVVERAAGSPVQSAALLAYANLSPTPPGSRLPELPIVDWGLDGRNDFAAVWDAQAGAVIHFHPSDQLVYESIGSLLGPQVDWGPAGDALAAGTPSAVTLAGLAANLDDLYAPGAYAAFTTVPPPDQHQIGYDATDFCAAVGALLDNVLALGAKFPGFDLPIDPAMLGVLRCKPSRVPAHVEHGWKATALDALQDCADGELSGAGLAAGEVNAALRTPLSFKPASGGAGTVALAAVVIGLGPDAATARAAAASVGDPGEVAGAADAALTQWLSKRKLPASAPPAVLQVARRALINVRVGTVASTGAIVASIARQPPYGLDWPRDGAFFNVLLDVSGQPDLAAARGALYAKWQRDEAVKPTPLVDPDPPVDPRTGKAETYPAHAWEMNYYADGMTGGTIRFEIDNTGFVLWSLVAHAGDAPDPSAWLADRWQTIRSAADLLAAWRDPATGLQALAQEDDNATPTQTLHGAVTTFGALDMAGRAARLLGHGDDAARWETRAAELRDAILAHLWDAKAGLFKSGSDAAYNPGSRPIGQTAWLMWPMRVLPWDDVRVIDQAAADLEAIAPTIGLEDGGGAYYLKSTLALALARAGDAKTRARVRALLGQIAGHATPGTHHFGEVALTTGEQGAQQASQRVANPHLWEGTLFYLTAMALEAPGALLRYDDVLPPSRVREAPAAPRRGKDGDGDDGGCRATRGRGAGESTLALLLACALLLWERRRSRGLRLHARGRADRR